MVFNIKLCHNGPIGVCLQVYFAIFYSHLIYGCDIWGLTTEENFKIRGTSKKMFEDNDIF